jgi:hypothetical protein
MTAPLTILFDVIPVLAMVLVIACIPLLGDGPVPAKASGGLSAHIPFRCNGDDPYRACVLEMPAARGKMHRFVGTEWEPYIAVAFCSAFALSFTMMLSGLIDSFG